MPLLCGFCVNVALRSEVFVFSRVHVCLSVGLYGYLQVAFVVICTHTSCAFGSSPGVNIRCLIFQKLFTISPALYFLLPPPCIREWTSCYLPRAGITVCTTTPGLCKTNDQTLGLSCKLGKHSIKLAISPACILIL